MYLLNLSALPRQAFMHGFLKGLAAPIMIFSDWRAPDLPTIPAVEAPRAVPTQQVLAADWHRIGADLANVVSAHGNAQQTTRSSSSKRHRKRR
jgi:hypothetical protein